MGAVTMTVPAGSQDGATSNVRQAFRDVTLSASYATNGETGITPGLMGMQVFNQVEIDACKTNNFLSYDYANNLLKAFVSSTGAEVANTTNLSGVTVRIRFVGK